MNAGTGQMKTRKELQLKQRTNEVFLLVQEFKLKPMEFAWDVPMAFNDGGVLIHSPTEEKFDFYGAKSSRFAEWTVPGSGGQLKYEANYTIADWSARIFHFRNWLAELAKWISELGQDANTPDLWLGIQAQNDLIDSIGLQVFENDRFSADDRNRIAEKLNELKAFITETNQLTTEQLEGLEQQVRYLKGASERVAPVDWRGLFFAVLISLLANGVFDPRRAQELLFAAAKLFEWLFPAFPQLPMP